MRLVHVSLLFVFISLLFSGCDGEERVEKIISEKDIKACEAAITRQEKLTKNVKYFADGALAGNVQSAGYWANYAYVEPRKLDSNKEMGMEDVAKIMRKPVKGDPAEYHALYKRYQGCIERMHEAGYGSGLPLVRAARLGVPVAQYKLYELLSGVVERNGGVKAGFVFNEQAGNHPYANRHYSDYGPLSPLSVATDKLPVVEVLEPAMASPSHSYMLDLEWRAPTGPWDPMYKVGKFKYEDTVFSPHELLIKAAAEREEYRARLAAVNFISSNSAGGREVAAKVLLGLAESSDLPLYDVLVNTCIATIHLRGIGSPVDFSKAADVMLSSREGGLVARGVMLACRDSIPLNSDASRQWLPYVNDRIGRDLVDAASHQFGWGGRGRDLEKAYFHYFHFILKQRRGDSSDMRFARMRMSEIEKILSPDALLALQKNCHLWSSRWHDGDGPSYADWRDRYLTDQQKPR
jgi:hypothetical protein